MKPRPASVGAAFSPVILLVLASLLPAGCCHHYRVFECRSQASAYRILTRRVDRLNHVFQPFGDEIHCYASADHPDNRMLRIDEQVQHVNAEVILKAARPDCVQTEIDRIYGELRREELRRWMEQEREQERERRAMAACRASHARQSPKRPQYAPK